MGKKTKCHFPLHWLPVLPPTSQASMDSSSVRWVSECAASSYMSRTRGGMGLRVEMLWSTFGEHHPTNEGNTRGKPTEWSEQRSRGNWGRLGDIWRARLPLPVLLFPFSLLAVTKAALCLISLSNNHAQAGEHAAMDSSPLCSLLSLPRHGSFFFFFPFLFVVSGTCWNQCTQVLASKFNLVNARVAYQAQSLRTSMARYAAKKNTSPWKK